MSRSDWFYAKEERHVFCVGVKFFIDDKLNNLYRKLEAQVEEDERPSAWKKCLEKIETSITREDYAKEIRDLKNRIGNAGDLAQHFKTTFMSYLRKIIPSQKRVHVKMPKAEDFLQRMMSNVIRNRRVTTCKYFSMSYNEQERFLVDILRITFSNLSSEAIVKVTRSVMSRTGGKSSFDTVLDSIQETSSEISPNSSVSRATRKSSSSQASRRSKASRVSRVSRRSKDPSQVHSFTVKGDDAKGKADTAPQPKVINININDAEKEKDIQIVDDADYETQALQSFVGGGDESQTLRSFSSKAR